MNNETVKIGEKEYELPFYAHTWANAKFLVSGEIVDTNRTLFCRFHRMGNEDAVIVQFIADALNSSSRIESLEKERLKEDSGWTAIRSEKDLPENRERYLWTLVNGDVREGYHLHPHKIIDTWFGKLTVADVVAYRPLPEPYKED